MGYDQNIQIGLSTKSKTRSYGVNSARLSWGKFYRNPDKDAEISAGTVDTTKFGPGANGVVASCGRQNASSGTEGSFDIYDGSTFVATIYWNNPWKSSSSTTTSSNTVRSDRVSTDYAVEISPYPCPCTGTIGSVNIVISHVD